MKDLHADRGENQLTNIVERNSEILTYSTEPIVLIESLIPENKGNCEPKHSYEVPKVSFKDRFAVFKFEFHYSCKFIRSLVLFLKDINFS